MTRRELACLIGFSLAALAIVLVFSPGVSTAEIQRRDRLSSADQFVDATYRYFLGRPADAAGLGEYETVLNRDGPDAVALAIMGSREFQQRHPTPMSPAETTSAAADFVDRYNSGGLDSAAAPDWPGRVGFVLLVLLTASALLLLQRLSARGLSGSALHIYLPRWLVVALFAALATTWFLNTQALFYAFAPGAIGYAEWVERVSDLAIRQGLARIWTPYPQATPMLLVLLEVLANTLSGWLYSDIWTSYTLFRWLFQAVFLLGPSIVLVSTTYRLGMLMSPATATVAASIVGFSFAPLYYGVASTVVTDPLPVALTVLAAVFVLHRRPAWAALALGLAAAMKLIPLVLLVPLLVTSRDWRSRRKLGLISLAVLAGVFLPFLLSDPAMFLSPFRWQSGRPPWESLYAFVNWLGGAPHDFTAAAFEDLGVGYNFGWVFWGITPPLTALSTPVPSPPLHWENVLGAAGALVSLLAVVAARSREPRSVLRWCLYALAVTFVWSPGWSPQYELYLVPFVALAFESPLVALGAVLALEATTFLEYPLLLPWAYFYGGSSVWLAWAATVARSMVLGWLALYVLRTEADVAQLRARLRGLAPRKRVVPAIATLMALGVVALPGASHAQTSGCAPRRPTATSLAPTTNDLDWPIAGGWFFTQASAAEGEGYSLVDDADARMWSEFQRLGGWSVLGYPASQRFTWHGRLSQATQRAVLQWSPVTGQVEFANVLDLIHDEGRDAELFDLDQIPPPVDVDEAGLPYEAIAANRLGWLDERPAIKAAYCDAPGGGDPLELWGLPTSKAVNVSASGEVYVLRTQRAAFQEWVDGASFAAPGQVTVVLAGDVAKDFEMLPDDAVKSISPP